MLRSVNSRRRPAARVPGSNPMLKPPTILLSLTVLLLPAQAWSSAALDEPDGKYTLDVISKPAVPDAPAAPATPGASATNQRAEGLSSPELPEEIPEPFRSELNQSGLRLSRGGEQPLYELWFRKQVPLLKTESAEMSVNYRQLRVGTFVGVLRSYGGEVDYREDPIDQGFYLLRYGLQPDDGDHIGTAESRDFLVLTRFKEDTRLDPVQDMDALIELALTASAAGDHPMILFLEAATTEANELPRIYRHAERDEWIAEVELAARRGAEEEESSLRLGLVLVGVSEHF